MGGDPKEQLSKPDLKNPLTWANICEVHENWVRRFGPKYGIDVPKYILGAIIGNIIGDDENCFGIPAAPFHPDNATISKQYLLIRLGWEINCPETPPEVKKCLEEFLPIAETVDWTNEENFGVIRERWCKEVKGFVSTRLEENKEYWEAREYKLEQVSLITESWTKFIYPD